MTANLIQAFDTESYRAVSLFGPLCIRVTVGVRKDCLPFSVIHQKVTFHSGHK